MDFKRVKKEVLEVFVGAIGFSVMLGIIYCIVIAVQLIAFDINPIEFILGSLIAYLLYIMCRELGKELIDRFKWHFREYKRKKDESNV